MPFRFTTDSVPQTQRLDYWQTMCSEHIGAFQLKDYNREGFNSSLDVFEMGDVKVARFRGVRQTFEQKETARRSSAPDDYIVALASDHTVNIETGERQRTAKGGLFLIDLSQPYSVAYPDHVDVTDLFIPRRKLETVLGSAHLAAGLGIDSDQSSFHTIAAFMTALAGFGEALESSTAARLATIAADLVAVGFSERMELEPSRSLAGASILYRAQAYIDSHLDVPGLDMARVAKATNVSIRRLYEVAMEAGMSLTDWMWERRLLRAHAVLTDQAQRCLTIATIAYKCGFTDQAHFSRRFKEKFGLTPTERRAQAAFDRVR